MEPYYFTRDGVSLYHGNALDVLPELGTVDLLVTDPPYGVEYQSGLRNARVAKKFDKMANDKQDNIATVVEILRLSYRALRECRHAYVFGPFDLVDIGFGGVTELIWSKGQPGAGDLTKPWGPSHERLSFGVRVASKANRQDGYGQGAARLRRGSILSFARLHGRKLLHPTQKPVLLLRELIESSSHIGEIVLDPFAGSGSTLMAAQREGRKAIGIEIEEKFCEIAAKRLADESEFDYSE